jgi:hypothetical protein
MVPSVLTTAGRTCFPRSWWVDLYPSRKRALESQLSPCKTDGVTTNTRLDPSVRCRIWSTNPNPG